MYFLFQDEQLPKDKIYGQHSKANTSGPSAEDVHEHLANANGVSRKNQNSTDLLLSQILTTLEGFSSNNNEKDKENQKKTDWMLVATVLDRVMFFLFTVLTIIICVVVLTKQPDE